MMDCLKKTLCAVFLGGFVTAAQGMDTGQTNRADSVVVPGSSYQDILKNYLESLENRESLCQGASRQAIDYLRRGPNETNEEIFKRLDQIREYRDTHADVFFLGSASTNALMWRVTKNCLEDAPAEFKTAQAGLVLNNTIAFVDWRTNGNVICLIKPRLAGMTPLEISDVVGHEVRHGSLQKRSFFFGNYNMDSFLENLETDKSNVGNLLVEVSQNKYAKTSLPRKTGSPYMAILHHDQPMWSVLAYVMKNPEFEERLSVLSQTSSNEIKNSQDALDALQEFGFKMDETVVGELCQELNIVNNHLQKSARLQRRDIDELGYCVASTLPSMSVYLGLPKLPESSAVQKAMESRESLHKSIVKQILVKLPGVI